VADFVAGLASRRVSALLVLLGQQAVGAVIAAAAVVVLGEALPAGDGVVLSLLAGVAGAAALGCFYRALAVGTMSVVAPISASGAALPVVVGLATGDDPGALGVAGLLITLVGVVLASRETGEGDASRQSIGLALLAAVGFGTFFLLSDGAAEASVPWFVLLARIAALSLLLPLVLRPREGRDLRLGRRDLGTIAAIGAFDLAATALYGLAQNEGLLSIVSVVGSLYPVMTVLLAWTILSERLRGVQAAGVVLAFIGVGLVAATG